MALRNPFSQSSPIRQMVNSVMSNLPGQTESSMWTVRREKQRKYAKMTVTTNEDFLKIYTNEDKGKVFECVLQGPRDSPDVFSLFRLSSEDYAHARFKLLHRYLQPFLNIPDKLYDVTALQKFSDLAKKPDDVDYSPAHVAVFVRMNEALVGPEVIKHINSQKGPEGKTPLLLAVETRSRQGVVQLLKCGASVDLADENGNNVFHYAARISGFGSEVIEILPHNKELLNSPNKDGQTAILVASKEKNFDVAIRLVKAGAIADISDEIESPVHYALKCSNLNAVKAMFEMYRQHGRAICSKHGGTPLHWAKKPEVIELLLEQGDYDINSLSLSEDTALSIMLKRNRPKCALTLLMWDADPNIRDRSGNTPLHIAIKNKDKTTVHFLIAFGADVNVVNNDGESPRHLAATCHQETSGKGNDMTYPQIIHALASIDAKRCPPGNSGCQDGCGHGGSYDGETLKKDQSLNDPGTRDLQAQYFDECQSKKLREFRAEISGSGINQADDDSTDGAAVDDAGDCLRDPSKRRRKDTVLCLDGGGIKGLILTELLLALEESSGKTIAEMFDWIVGTSTGGILAIALSQGRTVKQCRKLYMGLKDKVFTGIRPYNSKTLEDFLQDVFGTDTLLNEYTYPRILVSGTMGDRSPPALHLFRNFDPPETSSAWSAATQPLFEAAEAPSEQLAWKAARCTGAAPTYFASMGCYLDGGLIANNPTLDALTEIHEYYMHKKLQGEPEREIGAVVSLGTGTNILKPLSTASITRPTNAKELISAATSSVAGGSNLIEIILSQVTESRTRSVDRARAWCYSIGTPFFRFSPPLSKEVALDESRDDVLAKMLFETRRYILLNNDKIKELADHITSLEVNK